MRGSQQSYHEALSGKCPCIPGSYGTCYRLDVHQKIITDIRLKAGWLGTMIVSCVYFLRLEPWAMPMDSCV